MGSPCSSSLGPSLARSLAVSLGRGPGSRRRGPGAAWRGPGCATWAKLCLLHRHATRPLHTHTDASAAGNHFLIVPLPGAVYGPLRGSSSYRQAPRFGSFPAPLPVYLARLVSGICTLEAPSAKSEESWGGSCSGELTASATGSCNTALRQSEEGSSLGASATLGLLSWGCRFLRRVFARHCIPTVLSAPCSKASELEIIVPVPLTRR